jgi:hypothetical protein
MIRWKNNRRLSSIYFENKEYSAGDLVWVHLDNHAKTSAQIKEILTLAQVSPRTALSGFING